MRSSSFSFSPLLAGFVAVLVGYASSAAIIWQAAYAAGASDMQIAGWMTALGLGMGISTLALTLRYKMPILTAWSTPGAALLATSLQGISLPDATGIFLFANALIVLCGVTGIFAKLMKIVPPGLAAAMLAGILLRFGLHIFTPLPANTLLCGSMLIVWLLMRFLAPRYAIIAALIVGLVIACLKGDVVTENLSLSLVAPIWITPHFSLPLLISVGLPLFLVTMASQNAPGVATLQAAGYTPPVSPLIVATGGLALMLSPFGVFSICIAAISAAVCLEPDAHPDKEKRWTAAAAAGGIYLLAGLLGSSITALIAALPVSWLQVLAGLALFNTFTASLHQALHDDRQRDAAAVTFLLTASGIVFLGIGSAFWGLLAGGAVMALRNGLSKTA